MVENKTNLKLYYNIQYSITYLKRVQTSYIISVQASLIFIAFIIYRLAFPIEKSTWLSATIFLLKLNFSKRKVEVKSRN